MESKDLIEAIFLGSVGILFLVAVLFFILFVSSRKLNRERLLQQKLITQHKEELLIHSIEAQEKERDRLAAEIHDDLTSCLNAIHVHLTVLEQDISAPYVQKIETLKKAVGNGIIDSRRIAYDLFPVVLEKFGLNTAITELKDLNSSDRLKVNLETNIQDNTFEHARSVHIYRILQELIQNSVKHAQCTQISISLLVNENECALEYSDDGIGSIEAIAVWE